MSDDRLRNLERDWREFQTPELEIPYLQEAIRQGELAQIVPNIAHRVWNLASNGKDIDSDEIVVDFLNRYENPLIDNLEQIHDMGAYDLVIGKRESYNNSVDAMFENREFTSGDITLALFDKRVKEFVKQFENYRTIFNTRVLGAVDRSQEEHYRVILRDAPDNFEIGNFGGEGKHIELIGNISEFFSNAEVNYTVHGRVGRLDDVANLTVRANLIGGRTTGSIGQRMRNSNIYAQEYHIGAGSYPTRLRKGMEIPQVPLPILFGRDAQECNFYLIDSFDDEDPFLLQQK